MSRLYDGYYRGGIGRGSMDKELVDFLVLAINKGFTVKKARSWWENWMLNDYKKYPDAY